MQRRAIAEHGKEAGGSAVSFVMVLPILITLMCAIVDLGRLAFMGTELESATQTVCRRMADQVSLSGAALPSSCDITERSATLLPRFPRLAFAVPQHVACPTLRISRISVIDSMRKQVCLSTKTLDARCKNRGFLNT